MKSNYCHFCQTELPTFSSGAVSLALWLHVMNVATTSESWTETSAAAATVSQDGEPLSLPGVIDPGLDFVIGLAVAISSGMYSTGLG